MRILLLSPHTDDVELGAGGSIIKFIRRDHEILWVVFSTPEESLPKNLAKNTLKKEFLNVMKFLGLKKENFRIFGFEVRNLYKNRQEILEKLIDIRTKFNPHLVLGPSPNDYHQDHQIVANEMIRAFKTTSSIICYELPWNHVSFNTQLFVRLKKEHIAKKWEILKNYKSQVIKKRRYFSKEFIYGLAKTRGTQCNSEYAEAFEVIRWMM